MKILNREKNKELETTQRRDFRKIKENLDMAVHTRNCSIPEAEAGEL